MPRTVRNALQLAGIQLIFVVFSAVLMAAFAPIFTHPLYQLALNAASFIPLVILLWMSAESMAVRDLQFDEQEQARRSKLEHTPVMGYSACFHPMNGFRMGLIVQGLFLVMALLTAIPAVHSSAVIFFLNLWYIMFSELTKMGGYAWYLFVSYGLVLWLVMGFGYRGGQWKRERIRIILSRNEQRIRERSKVLPPQDRG